LLAYGATGIGIYLFNYKGGEVRIEDESVDARSARVFTLMANASHFDSALTTTIISRCTILRPNQLQFVLKGEFVTRVLFYPKAVTAINTYAIVDCSSVDENWVWDGQGIETEVVPPWPDDMGEMLSQALA